LPIAILILHSNGILLFDRIYGEMQIGKRKELFSGLISAIVSFMKELTSSEIKYLMTEDHEIFIARGDSIVVALVAYGKYDKKTLEKVLRELVDSFVKRYSHAASLEGLVELSVFRKFSEEVDAIFLRNGLISEKDIVAIRTREILERVSKGELSPDQAMGLISDIKENVKFYRVYAPSTPHVLKNAVIRMSTDPVTVTILENIGRGMSVIEMTDALKKSGYNVTPDRILEILESLRARGIVKLDKYRIPA